MEAWNRRRGRRWAPKSLGDAPLRDQLMALAPLQMPARREIIVGTTGRWTMHASNSRFGGDSVGWVGHLSGVLKCRGVAAHHVPPGQYPYPSTQLELFGPEGKPPLHYVRTISAGIYDEGRWKFLVSGEVQPFEEVERYRARRIRDRFDRELLVRYLGALGIRADDPGFFTAGCLIEEEGGTEHQWTATLEQARMERTHPWPSPARVTRENRGGVIAFVDGQRIYPGFLGFHDQQYPFAGGHRYSLELVPPLGGELPADLRSVKAASPTDAREILDAVERTAATYGYQNASHEYIINTIDQVTSGDQTIAIGGVCSQVAGQRPPR